MLHSGVRDEEDERVLPVQLEEALCQAKELKEWASWLVQQSETEGAGGEDGWLAEDDKEPAGEKGAG
ncbi:hypothetical protein OIY81_2391 [Cryptosporidium canis]|uniref:Uncharacterized protein n=1 Tax=Cryptosporidium canis TaxID=195482 RepID=A0ABQ8P3N3_9CRYT|nr:hypothetical protein OJ252_2979 [Cryptosporidium canis]KAJ1609360.1 hypothetical protein OIY81_2391 [Cryptosporidium canis]